MRLSGDSTQRAETEWGVPVARLEERRKIKWVDGFPVAI